MNNRLKIKELLLYSMFAVVIYVCKMVLTMLPNIEPVTLLLIILTCIIGKKAIYISIVYVMLEIMTFGFGFWAWGYLFLWPFLVCLTILHRGKMKTNNLYRAVISALFGLLFDSFYAFIICIISGFWTGITYYVSGIVFSAVHMLSNYFLMLCLGNRLYDFIDNLYRNYITDN